ncbi:hypothetical protein J6590_066453 [Homalodisca vitripennis]|nr:hypothetical protein J6590_066453 [Homalodisca vitripennis]
MTKLLYPAGLLAIRNYFGFGLQNFYISRFKTNNLTSKLIAFSRMAFFVLPSTLQQKRVGVLFPTAPMVVHGVLNHHGRSMSKCPPADDGRHLESGFRKSRTPLEVDTGSPRFLCPWAPNYAPLWLASDSHSPSSSSLSYATATTSRPTAITTTKLGILLRIKPFHKKTNLVFGHSAKLLLAQYFHPDAREVITSAINTKDSHNLLRNGLTASRINPVYEHFQVFPVTHSELVVVHDATGPTFPSPPGIYYEANQFRRRPQPSTIGLNAPSNL